MLDMTKAQTPSDMTLAAREAGFEPSEIWDLWKGILSTIEQALPATEAFAPARATIARFTAERSANGLSAEAEAEMEDVLTALPADAHRLGFAEMFDTIGRKLAVFAATTRTYSSDYADFASWKAQLHALHEGVQAVRKDPADDAGWRLMAPLLPALWD